MSSKDVVLAAMDAFMARDLDALLANLSEDVVVEMPYEDRRGYGLLDKAGFRQTLELVLSLYESFDLVFERVFELAGVDGVVAEYRSEAVLADTGVPYRNRYCGVFLLTDGRITSWREYDDPRVIDEALATPPEGLASRAAGAWRSSSPGRPGSVARPAPRRRRGQGP